MAVEPGIGFGLDSGPRVPAGVSGSPMSLVVGAGLYQLLYGREGGSDAVVGRCDGGGPSPGSVDAQV